MEDDFYDGRRAMRVQLARLFGSGSKLASSDPKTAAQWKKTLTAVLDELEQYLAANVDTDEFHRLIVAGGLVGAREALKQEDFWPGYVEGITRLAFILLGDYPDHKRRKKGRKDQDHYKLDHFRSLHWSQSPEQRFRTLLAAGAAGFPELSADPMDLLHKFRGRYGQNPTHADFLEWYRANHPVDYATVFR
jgi:hypothetical protein